MKHRKLQEVLDRNAPWGQIFAKSLNFEWGYFAKEGCLVAKYFQKSVSVLVIGSGNGREARPICHYAHRIICIDIAMMYLMSGKKLFEREGIQNVFFLQADMMQLPFREESFDFVFFSLYSCAGEHRFEILRNINRILRNDGLLLLMVTAPLYKIKYSKIKNFSIDHFVFFDNLQQLCQEISSCGFELLESAIDPLRPEYRFSILKKYNLKDEE